MAKRFIETSFFKSPFVRGLKGAYKGLYVFIICDCDGSGIWSADFEAASLYIGQAVDQAGFEKFFVEKGKAIDLETGRYFLPDFIEHQYPGGLSEKNIAHKNFIAELLKFNLLDENLKPLQSPFKGSNVKVMVKDKVEVKAIKPKNEKKSIPDEEEFVAYYQSSHSVNFPNREFSVRAKYQTWIADGWKDGYGKAIGNWKSKLMNTLPHLKQGGTTVVPPEQRQVTPDLPNHKRGVEYRRSGIANRTFKGNYNEFLDAKGCTPDETFTIVREYVIG